MGEDNNTTLLQTITALQTQVASIQSNLNFLLEVVQELKKENNDRRSSIDTFAASTRDRLVKIENDLSLGRWALAIIVGAILSFAGARVFTVIAQVESSSSSGKSADSISGARVFTVIAQVESPHTEVKHK